jgi:Protein of unknown function (DUF3558)
MRRLIVLGCLLLAGCTTADPGTPTAGDQPHETTTATSTPTSAPTTTPSAVHRPRNIDVSAIDICAVVTGLRANLGLDTDRPPLAGDSGLFPGSKDCFNLGTEANLALTLVAVVNRGATQYLDGANAKIDQTDASGFPLYVLTTPRSPQSCFGVLDVNDGQMIFINFGVASADSPPDTPQTTLCQRVSDIAKAAVALL